MQKIKHELILWYNGLLKLIPGYLGCSLRSIMLPIKIGKDVRIWDFVQIDYPSRLKIGNNVSINRGTIINAGGNVTIGNDVLIGPNVTIYSQNHKFDNTYVKINQQGYKKDNVSIGSNVWIASNVTILPGVKIGDNIVIGANSLVTKSINFPAVYAGNPLKIIKNFSDC